MINCRQVNQKWKRIVDCVVRNVKIYIPYGALNFEPSKVLINQYKGLMSLFSNITLIWGQKTPNIIKTKNSSNSSMQNSAKFRVPHSIYKY